MKYTDEAIITSIHQGNERDVLKYLYKKVLPGVTNYVCSNNGTNEDAFDLFQDAMVAFYKYVKEGKFNTKYNIENFIFSICRNSWINKAKRNKKKLRMNGEYTKYKDDAKNALEGLITEERAGLINSILKKLGEKCAQLLKYSIYENMSLKEICKKLGFTSTDAVKTRKYKCKQKLLVLMKEEKGLF